MPSVFFFNSNRFPDRDRGGNRGNYGNFGGEEDGGGGWGGRGGPGRGGRPGDSSLGGAFGGGGPRPRPDRRQDDLPNPAPGE